MKPGEYFITGRGWRVGPMTDTTKADVIARVIAMLKWSGATKKGKTNAL